MASSLAVRQDGSGTEQSRFRLDRGTMVAAALAVLLAQVALAIPAVFNGLFQQDLGTSASQLTWISDAFLVPVTLLELTFGVLGDLFGRKRLLIIGAGVMALGELVSVLTPGTGSSTDTRVLVLWIGQILSGIGAAALFPTTLAMVAAGTHNAHDRGRSIAFWAAALSSGGFISPVVGGLVAKLKFGSDANASWRWGFIAVLVLALISMAVSWRLAKDSRAPKGRSLDWGGQITIAISLFALLFAIIQAPTAGWGSAEVVVGFIVAAVAMVAFVMVERGHKSPLLRLELFQNRSFAIVSIVTVIGMFAFLGTAYATSVRLTAIQGFSPLKASVAFVLLNGLALAQVPLTARLMPRINPRWMLAGGLLLIGAGDVWMSSLTATHMSLGPVILPLALVGFGFAFTVSSVTAVAVNTVDEGFEGMASAATSQLRDLGMTLGPAIVGAISLGHATSSINAQVAASPTLQKALATFYGSIAHVPAAQKASVAAAIGAVKSGPLGQNGVPAAVPGPGGKLVPFNPLKNVAFHTLDHSYNIGYAVCGIAALVSMLLVVAFLRSRTRELVEPLEEQVAENAAGHPAVA